MQTYQSTPDYYRDYIEHGWLKDQAAKVHKYIKRWKNEAGKWVYQYKKPKSNPTFVNSQASKELVGDGGFVNRYDKGHKTAARREYIKRANDIWRARNGYRKTSKSAMKGDSRYKRPKTNLTSQGYAKSSTDGQRGSTLNFSSWVSGIDRAERSRLRRENEEYKKRGNKGNLKDRGYAKSTDGQRGYTLTWDSVKEGRKRANLSRKISNNKEMIANRKNNRPRARKKTVASGSYSVTNKRRIISDNEAYLNALMAAQQYHQNPYEKPPKKGMTNDPRYKKKKKS